MTPTELAEKLERFAVGPGSTWAQERTGEMADAMNQAAACLRSMEADVARLSTLVASSNAEAYKR